MSEPTPEAIEAAARAIGEAYDDDHGGWTVEARAALSAAAPYLIREAQAQALEDAAAHIYNDNICRGLMARAAAIRDGAQ